MKVKGLSPAITIVTRKEKIANTTKLFCIKRSITHTHTEIKHALPWALHALDHFT
jgi:hypothetical protein